MTQEMLAAMVHPMPTQDMIDLNPAPPSPPPDPFAFLIDQMSFKSLMRKSIR